MKPNPLDTPVVGRTAATAVMPEQNRTATERRLNCTAHRCKVKADSPPHNGMITSPITSPLSPRNADVIFQSLDWDMHTENCETLDCTTPSGESKIISKRKHPVVFRWHGEGHTVFLSGSFDNWKTKTPLIKCQDEMYTIIEVPLGVHQYKFLVDGRWACEPSEPQLVGDIGTPNNVITVTESDCDPFVALQKDDVVASGSSGPSLPVAKPPPPKYGQFIPPRDSAGFNFLRHGPPLLPPHLLQSVLNVPSAPHMDPIMLPPPNHVVLDHTFTLSIRDGVMVLSTTHRYRQKFVTTLLYRPI